jgi:dTDP-4-dehydrorhamnose 3,5-epimerase-like enzyme
VFYTEILDVVDLRKKPATYGQYFSVVLSADQQNNGAKIASI